MKTHMNTRLWWITVWLGLCLAVLSQASLTNLCCDAQQTISSTGSNSPLADAIEQQDHALANRFLQQSDAKQLLQQKQADGMTALHWAVQHGDIHWAKRLLAAGAPVDAATEYGITPLWIACSQGHTSIAAELLRSGADVERTHVGNVTYLMLAAKQGSADLIDKLVEQGCDLDAQQRSGQTAIMWAAAYGNADAVGRLAKHGADLSVTTGSGFTAFHFACRQGCTETAMLFCDLGVDVNQPMKPKNSSGRNPRKGMTPLMLAVENAHYELALKLVEQGADPNDQSSGFAPLHALAWVRRPQKGDNPEGDPPPRVTGDLSALQFVKALVDKGASVNLPVKRGSTPKGRLGTRGATPFLLASQTCDLPLMKTLLKLGADPNLTNTDGCTALLAAAGIGNHHVGEHPGTAAEIRQTVLWLNDLGLQINHVDDNGESIMHAAAYRLSPEMVSLVTELGADPVIWDRKNKYGWTPMLIAMGQRPGSVKPDPATMKAIYRALGPRAKLPRDEKLTGPQWESLDKP